jgi:hypothetical protein
MLADNNIMDYSLIVGIAKLSPSSLHYSSSFFSPLSKRIFPRKKKKRKTKEDRNLMQDTANPEVSATPSSCSDTASPVAGDRKSNTPQARNDTEEIDEMDVIDLDEESSNSTSNDDEFYSTSTSSSSASNETEMNPQKGSATILQTSSSATSSDDFPDQEMPEVEQFNRGEKVYYFSDRYNKSVYYIFGLVDILQDYNFDKWLEHHLKVFYEFHPSYPSDCSMQRSPWNFCSPSGGIYVAFQLHVKR